MKYEKMSKRELILAFRHKAGCQHTQAEANRIFRALKPYLSKDEIFTLQVAQAHAKIEDRKELDIICNSLLKLED